MSTHTVITPAQARKELARRKAAKGTAKRAAYPARHIFDARTDALEAIVAQAAKPAEKAAPKAKKVSKANARTQACNATLGNLGDLDAAGKAAWWTLYRALGQAAQGVARMGAPVFDGLDLSEDEWAELADAVKSAA